MALLTLCSDNYDISDQVFTIELNQRDQMQVFVGLVKEGGVKAGLIKPTINIDNNGRQQTISQRNNWMVDWISLGVN